MTRPRPGEHEVFDSWDSSWQRDAACAGHVRPQLFDLPDRDADGREQAMALRAAAAYCAECPVRQQCLAAGSRHGYVGVWGGVLLGESGSRTDLIARLGNARFWVKYATKRNYAKTARLAAARRLLVKESA